MLYEETFRTDSKQRMFEATISYITSQDVSIEEKKTAVDFFVDYVKKNHQEKTDVMVFVIKQVCNNAPDDFKKYCKKLLPAYL